MKKRNKYRILPFLLGATLLWGCGKQEDTATTPEETPIASTEQSTEAAPTESKEETKPVATKFYLRTCIALAENVNPKEYANYEIVLEPLKEAWRLMEDENATQEEVDAAAFLLRDTVALLNDGSGLPPVKDLDTYPELPNPFVALDGTEITTPEQWETRSEEISNMYEYYMYGVWRDGSDETVTYTYEDNTLMIEVKRDNSEKIVRFHATVGLPDSAIPAPEGGYPVIVGMHAGISEATAHAGGYATITISPYDIASDDIYHKGIFYELYPYGDTWQEQTGVLMAWAWGCSKVLDALEAGAAEDLGISSENTIVTGVSRWGKAAMVCGAFDKRFKMVAPSCSGAGGVALFRYTSTGKTYDFSSKGASNAYTYGANEPIGSLQANTERGWFNDKFMSFKKPEDFPFDQHLLCSTVADPDRYLFIIGSCISEDWVNAPSMWYSYLATQRVYDFLGISDHLAINIHKEGHAVIDEDMRYMMQYFNYHVYGIEPTMNLTDLTTSAFALEQNTDPIWNSIDTVWGK